MDETIIKIENAALKLKKFVIKPANLEIPKGYIVGIQGENGAGKTTLLHMMLAYLELSPRRRLCSFSTGEMIKYQFAFAAAYRPKVLLMDEPTANLDPVFRDDFLKLLQEFVAEYEMTILFATHLEEDLSRVADYVIDVKNGEYSMREMLE